jgi:D-apionolactonase
MTVPGRTDHAPAVQPADGQDGLPTVGQILRGTDQVPEKGVVVRAGTLSAGFAAGDVRHVRVGGFEVVRRIVVAVRDQAWNTVPPALSDIRIRQDAEAFEIAMTSRHEADGLCFVWEGLIRGASDGSCSFSMDGTAVTSFPYRRIGICVLLPPAEVAGRGYIASLSGHRFSAELPSLVAPPGPGPGIDVPLVPAFDRLRIAGRRVTTDFSFTGDQFEIEDQRNWTDDSFKAYSRFPAVSDEPEQMAAGTRLRQTVSISTTVRGRQRRPEGRPVTRLTIGGPTGARMPDVGLAHADQSPVPSGQASGLLARMAAAHLRVDVGLRTDDWPDRLARAKRQAQAMGCPLEVAVFLPEAAAAGFDRLAAALAGTSIRRVLVYRAGAECTPGADVAAMREVLTSLPAGTPFAGGTDVYFAQLNRTRPDTAMMDAVAFPVTPQVHAADEESITESADGVRAVVRTAQAFCEGRPVLVSPVSLRPRYNPDAPDEPAEPVTGLPDNVDARQMSVFGGCWALTTLKALAEEGVTATTWAETTGPRGVMENAAVPPFSRYFPSRPGLVFPLYHVLRDACELKNAQLLDCSSDEPMRCSALAVRQGDRVTVLVANLRPEPVTAEVRLPPAEQGSDVVIRSLNTETSGAAMLTAETYRTRARVSRPFRKALRLPLLPYEYTRLDYASTDEKDG